MPCEQKSHILQHEQSKKHRKQSEKNTNTQLQITELKGQPEKNQFALDLCIVFLSANIPWAKLDCPSLKTFLKKYCHYNIPDRTTLSKNYLPKCYKKTIEDIRHDIGNSNVWICVDETTDVAGRYIANLIVGKLSNDGPGVPHLLTCRVLEKTNNVTVARFVNESLSVLWPNGIEYLRVRLIYSYAASYMLKCATSFKVFYPNLIHFTCLAHELNRVCEISRCEFDEVDALIANTKKVFSKAPLRIQFYRQMLPETPLPPEPVLTRWGTWVKAAVFLAENFDSVKSVVMQFKAEEATCIKKELFSKSTMKINLIYISNNFKIITETITKLKSVGTPLAESMKMFNSLREHINKLGEGKVASLIKNKITQVVNKNPGFHTLDTLSKIYLGHDVLMPENLTMEQANDFKYAPVTSCDVERSFSLYKNVLTDRRHNLTLSNLEMILICYSHKSN